MATGPNLHVRGGGPYGPQSNKDQYGSAYIYRPNQPSSQAGWRRPGVMTPPNPMEPTPVDDGAMAAGEVPPVGGTPPATGGGWGSLFGDPDGRFLQYNQRMQGQVPVMDFASALKQVRPGHGRSTDAGTYAQAENVLAGDLASAAQQRSQIPFDLFSQQAQEQIGLGNLEDAFQGEDIRLNNQTLVPQLSALLDLPREAIGGVGGLLGGLLG